MPRTATLPDRPVRRKKKLPPKAATVLEEVLTLEEAAAYLRVSPADVDDLAAHQDLPGVGREGESAVVVNQVPDETEFLF